MSVKTRVLLAMAITAGTALAAPLATAATLSWERTEAGTTGTGFVNDYLSVPISDTYGRTFLQPTVPIAGSPGAGFGFYDDFLFHITGAVANSVTSTISLGDLLGINNLQVRLYSVLGNSTLPVLGTPVNLIDLWSTELNFTQGNTTTSVTVLPPTGLNPGTYVLEVRGNVVGSNGGSYAGTLNLAPIPLPGALALLLSGLGLLGFRLKCGPAAPESFA